MPSTAPAPPLRFSLRARHALFISWLTTSPFIHSFIEEELRELRKETRQNTLLNRGNGVSKNWQIEVSRRKYAAIESVSSSTVSEEAKKVCFKETVDIFDGGGEREVKRVGVRFKGGEKTARKLRMESDISASDVQ